MLKTHLRRLDFYRWTAQQTTEPIKLGYSLKIKNNVGNSSHHRQQVQQLHSWDAIDQKTVRKYRPTNNSFTTQKENHRIKLPLKATLNLFWEICRRTELGGMPGWEPHLKADIDTPVLQMFSAPSRAMFLAGSPE